MRFLAFLSPLLGALLSAPRPTVIVADPVDLSASRFWRLVAGGLSWAILAGLVALLAVLVLAGIAHAEVATAAPAPIDLGPIAGAMIEILVPVVLAFLSALAAWAFALFRKKTGWQINGEVGKIVDQGLTKAVDYAAEKLKDRAAGGIPIAMKNEAIRIAAGYAAQKLPGALKHFGITDQGDHRLAEMIEARLTDWLVDPETERRSAVEVS
ncbi:hypothetical protein [Aurantimonas sp. 22II-16-19i]|uniref:hypothetical protein n=1 Tax=Aurantimonas sp. 22II-16-19i TaxID=1317114 RepID=UPI0009F7EAA1|nr:hypothetical protein [Aurantimonas sp. 22II-16-19i]ORE93218.1 hypothetical protein ATO4_15745 [Aurantimonas sp. 22II-16-19i]